MNRDHWNSYLREYDPEALAAFYLGAELLGEPARRAAGLVNNFDELMRAIDRCIDAGAQLRMIAAGELD